MSWGYEFSITHKIKNDNTCYSIVIFSLQCNDFPLFYGFRIKRFNISATKVSIRSMKKVAIYPPVTSNTRLEAVAINEPTITVKVISAILLEKCFIPKKEEVNAAVMVGHAP